MKFYLLSEERLALSSEVITKLNHCDDYKCRHGWTEQEIHRASFPTDGLPLEFDPQY